MLDNRHHTNKEMRRKSGILWVCQSGEALQNRTVLAMLIVELVRGERAMQEPHHQQTDERPWGVQRHCRGCRRGEDPLVAPAS
jgi:hypothetical protein